MVIAQAGGSFDVPDSTVDIPGATVPLVLELKHQFIEDERLDEKFHVNVENLGRSGSYFKAMVDV